MAKEKDKYNLLGEIRPDVDATLEAGMQVAGIPAHMHEGLTMYLRYGIRPGRFLTAMLAGEFMEACAQADVENQQALFGYARFFNNLPPICYGSRERVEKWLQLGAERRKATEATVGS